MTANQTRQQIRPVLADLASLVDAITDEQRSLPTPCSEYDVTALTGHTVGWLENFAGGFASEDGTCPQADVSDIEVDRNQAADRITAAADRLDGALATGAADRDLVIQAQGGMPGEMALSMMLGEYIVHGWDLATATGQSWNPDEQAVTSAHEFLKGMVTPEYRGPDGMFGPEVEVADDAPALDKLLGFTGRDPRWSARA